MTPGKAKPCLIRRTLVLALAAALGPISPLLSQTAAQEMVFSKIKKPIQVDGLLSEPSWKSAPEAGILLRVPTLEEGTGVEPTSVKILAGDDVLYVGFFCRDSRPDAMIAHQTLRDADIRADESVFVLIDALAGEKILYIFGLNMLGTQVDALVNPDDLEVDARWNGQWQTAVQKQASGWSAEIAIHLRSLGFKPELRKPLGIQFCRIIPRLAPSFWQGPLDPVFDAASLSQMKTIDLAAEEKRTQFSAHVLPMTGTGDLPATGAGMDFAYALTPGLQASAVLNPEFTTVDPDREIINLTRFELYYPEKRDFFQADRTQFGQPIRLFYSKRIGDIWGGANFSGKAGDYDLNALSVFSKADDVLRQDSANFTAFRLGRRFGASSSFGVQGANRFSSGRSTGTLGMDADWQITKAIRLTGQAALAYGELGRDDAAYSIGSSIDTRTFHFRAAYTRIGDVFGDNANAVGFIPDDNRKEVDSILEKAFLLSGAKVDQIRYFSRYNIYWGTDDTLRSWEVLQGLAIDLSSKFTLSASHFQEYKLFEKEYRNHRTRLAIEFNAREEWQAVSLAVTFGRNFGFPFDMIDISKRLQVTKDLFLEYDVGRIHHAWSHPDRPEGKNAWTQGLRINQNIGPAAFFRIYVQYHSVEDFHLGVTGHLARIHLQALASWRLLEPYGTFQIGYLTRKTDFGSPRPGGGAAFLKFIASF